VSDPTETITIDVQAFIDGRDLLVIQGNTLQWDHLDYSAVGLWNGSNYPTTITTYVDGVQQNQYSWTPDWPASLSTGQSGTGDSSIFTGLTPALPSSDMSVSLDTISARDSLTIYQLPTASNNQTLILDFNDDPSSGATWYDARITITIPVPATHWTNTQGGNWSTTSNWNSGVPAANLEAEVDSAGTYSVAITAKNATALGLSINDAQATVTDGSGALLTLAGTGGADGALNIDAGTFVLNGGGLKAGTIFIGSGGTLQIAKGTYTGTNALSEAITNNGSIIDKVRATITGNLSGAGTVLVENNANLTINGNLTGNEDFSLTNSAHVLITTAIYGFTYFTIANSAVLEVGKTADFGGLVTFASGSNGTVKFDQSLTQPSTTFAGWIAGLTPQTKIDLADLTYVPGKMAATYDSSTSELTVSNGTNSVSLNLSGDYSNATWTLSKDATGGTLVVDPPATTSPPTSTLDSLVADNVPTASSFGLTTAQTSAAIQQPGGTPPTTPVDTSSPPTSVLDSLLAGNLPTHSEFGLNTALTAVQHPSGTPPTNPTVDTSSPPTSVLDSLLTDNLPKASSFGLMTAQTSAGVQHPNGTPPTSPPGLDHVVALFSQFMAAGLTDQHVGAITTNALSQITTNEQQFLANPHHG
jgi:hypothetical protein